ncbi:hypothetical protein [Lysinibacillus parviboronicapiens]|uniref:hypothetical protein n=1 Tax=Lysinibacillus parviboronicapiens TaxID=436516 RepID=UPI00187D3191|nr:hypothetical protein [Lysinibacillus parviboronicapiens]
MTTIVDGKVVIKPARKTTTTTILHTKIIFFCIIPFLFITDLIKSSHSDYFKTTRIIIRIIKYSITSGGIFCNLHTNTSTVGQFFLWFGASISLAEIVTGSLIATPSMTKDLQALLIRHVIGAMIL